MDKERIINEMHNFELILNYKFNDINFLAEAMKSKLIRVVDEGKNHKEYSNEKLALIGDTLLKFIIVENLYNENICTKKEINVKKEKLENNTTMHKLMIDEKWIDYSYNDSFFTMDNPPDNKKVVNNGHDPYVEAIIGAIYIDSNFDIAKKWINDILLPLLKKHSS